MTTDYVLFMNDDMYVLPGWDAALYDEIQAIGHQMFFLSATLIQPRKFFCKSVIAPANYGESIETFEEERLLKEFRDLKHGDWQGATWPPNIVHRDLWDRVGGYSVEYSPGVQRSRLLGEALACGCATLQGCRQEQGVSLRGTLYSPDREERRFAAVPP